MIIMDEIIMANGKAKSASAGSRLVMGLLIFRMGCINPAKNKIIINIYECLCLFSTIDVAI